MDMKFDEAIEELRLAIPEKFYSPTMYDIAVMIEAQNKIINLLREEYAPIVEMTKEQYDYISQLLQESNEIGATFTEFWEVYIFTGLSKKIKPAFESKEQAMQAWLHKETIKVVD